MLVSISSATVVCFSVYAVLVYKFISSRPDHKLKALSPLILLLLLLVLSFKLIELYALPFIITLFALSLAHLNTQGTIKNLALILLSGLALAFSLHIIPGFNNELLFASEKFGESSLPFKLYANLDKALAGLAILIAMGQHLKWRFSFNTLYSMLAVVLLFFSLCLLLGAKLDPKLGELTLAFIFFNLLVTCIAEEAFFRLVIQNNIHKLSKGLMKGWFAVFTTAIIFMLAHFHTQDGAE